MDVRVQIGKLTAPRTLQQRAVATAAVLPMVALLAGCHRAPAAPTPPPVSVPPPSTPAPPLPPPPEFSVSGVVVDNVSRPLADARVEVIDGPGAGAFAVTDSSGRYALPGLFSNAITARASKEGYFTTTRTFAPSSRPSEHPDLSFILDSPSINIAGEYSMTIAADSACTEFPAAARSRTYLATVTPSANIPNAYQLELSDATFYPFRDRMFAAVAGDVARFAIDPYDTSVSEELAPSAILTFWGDTRASVGGPRSSAPFSGELQYCDRALGPLGAFPYVSCAVPPVSCVSDHHSFTLTRRGDR